MNAKVLFLVLGVFLLQPVLAAKPAGKSGGAAKPKPRQKSQKKQKIEKLKAHEFEGFKSQRGIIHADKKTLAALKQTQDYVVVLFGAHVCQECSNLLDAMEALAPEVHNKGVLVPFTYFLCESEESYCDQAERISVAPTLRIYHKNMFIEYTSIKNEEGVARWILDRLVHSSHNGTDKVREIKSLARQSEVVIILQEGPNFRQFDEFKLLTIFYEFGHFFYTNDEKTLAEVTKICRENVGQSKESLLFIINPEDNKCYYYTGAFNYKKIMKFIVEHDKIAVSRFDESILRLQQKYQVPISLFLTRDAASHPFYPVYTKVAEEFKNKMVFSYIEEGSALEDSLVKRLMNTLGVDRKAFPTIRVMFKQPDGTISKWKYDGELDKTKFRNWVSKLLNRKIKPYHKSEDLARLADENEKSEIERISALNFEAKIEEESEPIMLVIEGSEEICQGCDEVHQKVLEIRDKFRERQGKFPFKLYRLNVQLNDIPNWVFETVPQIVFVRKNKKIEVFDREIELNSVVAFMEERLLRDGDDAWREDL